MNRLLLLVLFAALAAASNRLPSSLPPEIYAWFWMEPEFQPDGYRAFIDLIAEHSNFGLLTTSPRVPSREVTEPETHDQVKRAVLYAHSRGLRVAFDLDVRLARGEFRKQYPDQQQWMLRIVEVPENQTNVTVRPLVLSDHMTGSGGSYEALSGKLLGVFRRGANNQLVVVQAARASSESAKEVQVKLPVGTGYIVAAAFEYRTPDAFAPALLEFQRSIYEQYRDIPLDGAMKDEWGFPPVYSAGPRSGEFWYSKSFASAWRKAGGGDMVRDCVLMFTGAGGTHQARIGAANRYERLLLERNAEIERSYYSDLKRVFGAHAFAGTHATWGRMPSGDAFKNGYDWWWATRDYGQTDEDFPIPLRTSLAKKMGGPVWYNQFYNADVEPYAKEVWRDARAGGRVNFHPLWPSAVDADANMRLLASPAVRAEDRIRLLNYVSRAPRDCPVAVVFGHAAATNWLGPRFGDLGMDFAEAMWREGFPADVIPSTEIESGALKIDDDGLVRYGVQQYRALVFLNTEYEPRGTFEFLRRAARSSTVTFVRDTAAAAGIISGAGLDPTPERVAVFLRGSHTLHDDPADLARLTDGTCILARGERNPAGDAIDETFYCGKTKVRARATGVFAIRVSRAGELQSLAGSDVRLVEAGKLRLEFTQPVDFALWRDAQGALHGVVQGNAPVPDRLLQLTKDWARLDNKEEAR
ncbi:MAG: hypothetical protein LLG20_08070 [Acidobacteriales bacterium]|nr:hypothetical protein [Terriglobales bacterium]